jgi:hypothetical protein
MDWGGIQCEEEPYVTAMVAWCNYNKEPVALYHLDPWIPDPHIPITFQGPTYAIWPWIHVGGYIECKGCGAEDFHDVWAEN